MRSSCLLQTRHVSVPGQHAHGDQCQQAGREPQTMAVKETVQSSACLRVAGQAWLGAGMISEGWQKEAIVCLHSLPQGHESFLLPSPEAKGPAVQDNTVNQGKSLPAPSSKTGKYSMLQMASHQRCGTRIKCLLKQRPADFGKASTCTAELSVWDLELETQRSQARVPLCPANT